MLRNMFGLGEPVFGIKKSCKRYLLTTFEKHVNFKFETSFRYMVIAGIIGFLLSRDNFIVTFIHLRFSIRTQGTMGNI